MKVMGDVFFIIEKKPKVQDVCYI